VCDAAKATRDEHRAAFDAMNRELRLSIGPVNPTEYLPRFASELDLGPGVERRACQLAEKATETGIVSGRNPGGVAAACLYTAASNQDLDLTQKAAADVADVTPSTIRSTYRALTE
jgi:Transcription initiation factor IIB (TFIIB)